MSDLPLDSRQSAIARSLLERAGVASIDELAADLQLTHRVVRYNLPSVAAYLGQRGLQVEARRGVGIWVIGDESARARVRAAIEAAHGPSVLEAVERQSAVLLALLEAAPDALRSEALEARLDVSRPTVRRDVRVAEGWLEQHRLHVRRLPGVGIAVRGSEVDVRAALLSLILERTPAQILSGLSATSDGRPLPDATTPGLGPYLRRLERDARC